MAAPDAPRPPADAGADAEYMAFHRLVGYARHAEGCAYSDTSDAACSCGLWEAHDTLGNLLAARPAPSITAAEQRQTLELGKRLGYAAGRVDTEFSPPITPAERAALDDLRMIADYCDGLLRMEAEGQPLRRYMVEDVYSMARRAGAAATPRDDAGRGSR
jgi:hypothetical protein